MTSRVIIISLIGILIVGFHDCLSQDLQSDQALQTLDDQEKISQLQGNLNAMSLALIKFAKNNKTSVSDAGIWVGKLFAQSWGENLTPEDFVKRMNNNWQMFDIKTEIIEATSDKVKAKRDVLISETEFQETYGHYGLTRSELQTFFAGIMKGITSSYDLSYSEELDGDLIHFTVATNN